MPTATVSESASAPQPTGEHRRTRRLVAVAAVDRPGGAETTLMRLLSALRERGWQITLATPGDGPLRAAGESAGHRCLSLPVGGLAAGAGARALGSWQLADVVLAASGAVGERLGPLSAHVVYGPVDPDPPAVAPPWTADGAPVVGFVGRIEPRKGTLDLVRAAPAIRAVLPDARVVVVGDDPYGTDPAYTATVTASREVEHHGWVPNAPGLMRHFDVLVLPSHEEPFGTVLAEAMAVGTPVVATRVGGLAEVVDDGVTGRLVAPGDPAQLAAAVLEVLRDRERMGAAARERARRFDASRYAERVERLLAA